MAQLDFFLFSFSSITLTGFYKGFNNDAKQKKKKRKMEKLLTLVITDDVLGQR